MQSHLEEKPQTSPNQGNATFIRASVGTLGFSVTIAAVGVVSGVLIARTLGPTGKGEVAAAFLYVQLATWIAGLGFSRGAIRLLGAGASPPAIAGNCIWHSALTGVPAAILLFLFLPLLLRGFSPSAVVATRLYCLFLPLLILSDEMMNLLLGLREYVWFNLKRLSDPVLYVFALVAAKLLGVLSIPVAIGALALSNVASLAVGLWVVRRRTGMTLRGNRALFGEALSFGLKAHLGDVARISSWRLDQVVMAPILGPYQLGLYSAATSVSEVGLLASSAVSAVLFPEASSRERVAARRLIRNTVLVSLLVIGCGTLVLLPAARLILAGLYGGPFLEGTRACQILIIASVPLSLSRIVQHGLFGLGRPIFATYGAVASMVVLVVGLLVMLPRAGIVGAALVSVVAYSVELVIVSGLLRRT